MHFSSNLPHCWSARSGGMPACISAILVSKILLCNIKNVSPSEMSVCYQFFYIALSRRAVAVCFIRHDSNNQCLLPTNHIWRIILRINSDYFPYNINRLTPNDPYTGLTAPLTSKRCISYIYSTNIGTEYFKHALHSPSFLFKMQFVS